MAESDIVAALSYLENRIQADPKADANIKELTSAVRALSEDLAELQRRFDNIQRAKLVPPRASGRQE
jgi:hypothetical protein